MKPLTPKENLMSGLVILAAVIFSIATIGVVIIKPSIWSALTLISSAYGIFCFVKKNYKKNEE